MSEKVESKAMSKSYYRKRVEENPNYRTHQSAVVLQNYHKRKAQNPAKPKKKLGRPRTVNLDYVKTTESTNKKKKSRKPII